jgi:hypothetical protein
MVELDKEPDARWTPISLAAAEASRIEWADLSDRRFNARSFRRMIEAWRTNAARPTVWTGVEALDALDGSPSLDPTVIIAHAARCGSTLLAQQLGALDATIMVSEAGVIGSALAAAMEPGGGEERVRTAREVIRALGRIRFGDEARYVIKLSSSTIRYLPALRRIFPSVTVVWLQRRPGEIIESLIRAPSRWLNVGTDEPEQLASAALHKLTLVFMAARVHLTDDMLLVDYSELPDAAWRIVCPAIGISPTSAELDRMHDASRYHGHTGEAYLPRPLDPLPASVAAAVAETLDPIYAELDRRRIKQRAA